MHICAAWLLTHAAPTPTDDLIEKRSILMSGRCSLTPSLRLLGRGFLASNALVYFNRDDATTAARRDAAKRALENAQKLAPNSPETLLALGYYQYLGAA